jgi:hypothetical protein
MSDLLAAYRDLSRNWVQIQDSRVCGCCNCLQTFPSEEVIAWTGLEIDHFDDQVAVANQTALCPRCGSESVIGDKSGFPINHLFLGRMNEAWFQRTLIRMPHPKGS